jgi:Domain of unknown function (DUF4148)
MKMKQMFIAVALVAASASVSALAQSVQPAASTPVQSNVASASTGQWTPPYGQAVKPKTRAQVYHELIHAEQDGQLAYLDSTVYAGG